MEGMDNNSATPTHPATDSSAAPTATPAAGQGATAGATTEVQGTLREWAIDLSQQEVPAGKVIFTVTNQGGSAHNFTVQDSTGVIGRTPNFSRSDGPQMLEVELAPGTYTIICSLPGHAARGQQTTLVVK
jgi:plastocyanin